MDLNGCIVPNLASDVKWGKEQKCMSQGTALAKLYPSHPHLGSPRVLSAG